jgi:organic radical activating enzyme
MKSLKDYICIVPFDNLQIHRDENFVCCPQWLNKSVPNKETLVETWNCDDIREIRESILDGTYRYCDSKHCTHLSELFSLSTPSKLNPIIHKSLLSDTDYNDAVLSRGPKNIELNFDMTCNYKCPSCRTDYYVSNTKQQKQIESKLKEIDNFADSIQSIYSSTTGDPFASVPIRNYFRNFEPKKYKKLKNIHIHTNGSLWDKEMWDSMKSIHQYVHTCEISIDAATKDTYENKTRIGGNWETLINNLNFISTIDTIHRFKCSFVVQKSNYKEMQGFVELIKSIFGSKGTVFFCRLQNWNSYTPNEYVNQEINNQSHPEFNLFVEEFNKVCYDDYVRHNLHEYMVKNKKMF